MKSRKSELNINVLFLLHFKVISSFLNQEIDKNKSEYLQQIYESFYLDTWPVATPSWQISFRSIRALTYS